jgi:hypothetical protein
MIIFFFPNNSIIFINLFKKNIKYLINIFIDIDRDINTNNINYKINNINIISILLISNIENYIFENNYYYYKFHEEYYYFLNNDPE